MEIPSVGLSFAMLMDGQTDRYGEGNSRFLPFCERFMNTNMTGL
jgi:hypothetical protein